MQDGDIARFDSVTNTATLALGTYSNNPMFRGVFIGSVSYFTTTHDIKAGYSMNYAKRTGNVYSTSGMRAVYRSGVPDSVNTYNTPVSSVTQDREQGLYIQDKWRPTRKLTLNMGLRFETNYGWMPETCQVQTQFIAAQCFDAIEGAPDWKAVNPRFSIVYDLLGDGSTALKFAANRYVVPVGVQVVGRINPVRDTNDTRQWLPQSRCGEAATLGCDRNGDLIPQLNELGPSSGYNLGTTARYADGYDWPNANEYTDRTAAAASRQPRPVGRLHASREAASAGPAQRRGAGQYLSSAEGRRAQQRADRHGLQPGSGAARPARHAVGQRSRDGQHLQRRRHHAEQAAEQSLDDDRRRQHRQERRLCRRGRSQQSRTRRNSAAAFRETTCRSRCRMSGLYELPYGMSLSGSYQHQSGFPELTTVSVGNNTVPLTQGTQAVNVEPRGDVRYPKLNQLDFSLRKAIRMGSKVFQPRLDIYNVTNNATIRTWVTQLGPDLPPAERDSARDAHQSWACTSISRVGSGEARGKQVTGTTVGRETICDNNISIAAV